MDATSWVRLVFILLVLGVIVYAIRAFIIGLNDAKRRREREYDAYQAGIDDNLRHAGHTEEYVRKDRDIRALKDKHMDAKWGYYSAWVGGIICLFVFPPIGIPLTIYVIIATIREGKKSRKEMNDAAENIAAANRGMPSK
jgi:phage shock protein PspC (stress-responsive transcriptional regulator)